MATIPQRELFTWKGIEKLGEEVRCGGPESIMDQIKKAEEVGVPIIKELGLYIAK